MTAWDNLPPTIKHIAETHLTANQLAAWKLETHGYGQRRIALELGITRSAVIARLDNAYLKLRSHGVRQDASGNWYLEPLKVTL